MKWSKSIEHTSSAVAFFIGVATRKLLMSHNSTRMYLYGDLEVGICLISMDMLVIVEYLCHRIFSLGPIKSFASFKQLTAMAAYYI